METSFKLWKGIFVECTRLGWLRPSSNCNICGKELESDYKELGIGPVCMQDVMCKILSDTKVKRLNSEVYGLQVGIKKAIDDLKEQKKTMRESLGFFI